MKSGELDSPPSGVSSQVDSNPDSEESDDNDDPIIAQFGDQAKAIAEAGAEQVGLDIATKSLCTLIVTGIEALLNGVELAIPLFREITIGLESLAEVFANRFIIKAYSDLVEKEGKAAIKATENKLEPKRVTKRPTNTRPPKSSHTSARTRTTDQYGIKRADNPNCKRRKRSARTTTEISDQLQGRITRTITLDCDRYPQPCWHYSSVISNNPHSAYVTCPYRPQPLTQRGAVDEWNNKHDRDLVDADVECEADEWPATKYIEVNNGYKYLEGHGNRVPKVKKQFIRLLSQAQNGAASQKFKGCPKMARREDIQTEISLEAPAHEGLYTE
ncbi:uncharacterized protein N7477_003985 [Penicillium maclennaniae]|uniref:uncharacterized protein n=1 Tax=Penicillium maclennaniae TaxID=1343394 RepID=UPI002540662A|nr:uncharacterized protein N7477_003985 [Penicillium maclennaniae]KAJ5678352.1 hypothetical protein N7477_003985 [Penicillium maclennaniae]